MRRIWVRFVSTEDKVGGILADLADRVMSVDYGVEVDVPHNKNKPAKSNTKDKTPTLKGTIIDALKHGPVNTDALRKALTLAGYKESSLSNQLSELHTEKKVKIIARGVYALSGKGTK